MSKRFFALTGLILVAALSRFLPHPWNWTAVGATALLGGGRFQRLGEAVLVPLAVMGLTDAIIGFHSMIGYVYGAYALTAVGAFLFREKITGGRVGVAALVASTAFYLITNFGMWFSGSMYPPTFAGLATCYVAAFPFFVSQLLGDIFYAGILFFVWDRLEKRDPALSKL